MRHKREKMKILDDEDYSIINDEEVYEMIKTVHFNNKNIDLKIKVVFMTDNKTIEHTIILDSNMMIKEEIIVNEEKEINYKDAKLRGWVKSKIHDTEFKRLKLLTRGNNSEISSMFGINNFPIDKNFCNLDENCWRKYWQNWIWWWRVFGERGLFIIT